MTVYWSSSWARILNVQDIIIERTKETSISLTCKPFPSTTIAGAGQTQNLCIKFVQWWINVKDVGPTLYKGNTMFCVCWAASMQHNVPTQYRFNVGTASQPIAGLMPVNRIHTGDTFSPKRPLPGKHDTLCQL